jgi:hypothetical protein
MDHVVSSPDRLALLSSYVPGADQAAMIDKPG